MLKCSNSNRSWLFLKGRQGRVTLSTLFHVSFANEVPEDWYSPKSKFGILSPAKEIVQTCFCSAWNKGVGAKVWILFMFVWLWWNLEIVMISGKIEGVDTVQQRMSHIKTDSWSNWIIVFIINALTLSWGQSGHDIVWAQSDSYLNFVL